MARKTKASPAERLARRSVRQGDCLVWQGCRGRWGYGSIGYDGRTVLTHRLAWELANGRPPAADMCVCHRCDNPACVEPSHLFLGTVADNNADMMRKGRHVSSPGERNGSAKLTRQQVEAILADRRPQHIIAREYNVVQPHVSRIKRTTNWVGIIQAKGGF